MAPPLVFDDVNLEALAETIWEIHKDVVSNAGLDLTQIMSEQERETRIGTILSVLNPVFAPVFVYLLLSGTWISLTR